MLVCLSMMILKGLLSANTDLLRCRVVVLYLCINLLE